MSTKGARDYRPTMHYAPPTGWINDPNGLLYENGTWHLFAQHNPAEPVWGPMHWRHATSTDLLNWQDQGIAMYPDEKLGTIYSGSAIIDKGNTSGLGDGTDPMILVYTHHGETEQQSIAYSNDRMHFTPYQGNPVIPNPGLRDFRDPKVFRNERLDCWSLVLAASDHAEFYASDDLIHWRKTGEFGAKENRLGGVFECTDLFPLTAPDGSTVWVLVVSTALHPAFGSGRMQYFLGEFDGETFRETMPSPLPRFLDTGYDDYAAVTFANTDRRLMIGWAACPGYANLMPTGDFCCCMTYVRELGLVDTDTGLKVCMKPVTPDFDMREAEQAEPIALVPRGSIPVHESALPGELFKIHVTAKGCCTLTLYNDEGEAFSVSVDTEQKLVVDRTHAGENGFSALYDSGICAVSGGPRSNFGEVSFDLYFDRMIAEVYLDEGTVVNTSLVFPRTPYTHAKLCGEGTFEIG
ncbi:MAG: glycoside hydrolase family 32 protein [Clostridiales bacterium]|nr:glycoside hydrolase family 32 protein [Clostridiales bacterium]